MSKNFMLPTPKGEAKNKCDVNGFELLTAFTVTSYFVTRLSNFYLASLRRTLVRLFNIELNVQVSDTTGDAYCTN